MKKIAALLLVLLISTNLTGCCCIPSSLPFFNKDDSDAVVEVPEENFDAQAEVPEEPTRDTKATVTISRIDRSIKNSSGEVLINHFYDQVFVTGNFEGAAKINSALVADMTEFFNLHTDLQEMALYADPEYSFICTRAAEITHNGDGILCIEYTDEWFMGGVFNADPYPFVFNLNTGETPSLTEITGMNRAYLESEIKSQVCDFLVDFAGDPCEDFIGTYSLEDFNYSVRDGKIAIVFSCYEIFPDSFIVDTNIEIAS